MVHRYIYITPYLIQNDERFIKKNCVSIISYYLYYLFILIFISFIYSYFYLFILMLLIFMHCISSRQFYILLMFCPWFIISTQRYIITAFCCRTNNILKEVCVIGRYLATLIRIGLLLLWYPSIKYIFHFFYFIESVIKHTQWILWL